MLRKIIFITVLVFLSTVIYGQERRVFSTSEGSHSVIIEYIGRNKGQENADLFSWDNREIKLSNNQMDYVKTMLNLYKTSRGDTFYLVISFWPTYWTKSVPFYSIIVIVEFTTNTNFNWWAYKYET